MAPFEQIMARNCATLLTDGWDTADRDHLINFLWGNSNAMFFDGTVQLGSEDHENADMMFTLCKAAIEKKGRFAFIQVCTDTCSVMKVCVCARARVCAVCTCVCDNLFVVRE